jgi:low temperature requirement protein LtrA
VEWLELFFDLVVVADVAGELTRVRTVVVSMFLVAVMAASAPGHFDTRADAFAGAFVLVRVFAARGSLRTGRLMTGWPLLQAGGFTLPWLVSLAVPTPWKYGLWALGLALDLVAVLARSEGLRDDDRKRLEERLGLFVIIVLGESVAALVLTAARTPWTRDFVATSVAGFLLLVLLWLLTFSYGFSSAPGVWPGSMPPRFGLPLHLASTLGILLIGVGLGAAVAELAGARRPVAGRPVRRGHRDPAVGAAHVGRGPRPAVVSALLWFSDPDARSWEIRLPRRRQPGAGIRDV